MDLFREMPTYRLTGYSKCRSRLAGDVRAAWINGEHLLGCPGDAPLTESSNDSCPCPAEPQVSSCDARYAAIHEAGHAVTYELACRGMGINQQFQRVQIRPDMNKPLLGSDDEELDARGVFSAPAFYRPTESFSVSPDSRILFSCLPTSWMTENIKRMQWEIIRRLAGPTAEAVERGVGRSDIHLFAHMAGGQNDLAYAESVLCDYRLAAKRRYGLTRFFDLTRKVVKSTWPAIAALADVLLSEGMLDHERAYPIIDRHLKDIEKRSATLELITADLRRQSLRSAKSIED